jgi:isopenicillin N synthase-like dioxygenase
MATSFTSLPIIDLAPLGAPHPSDQDLQQLSDQLSNVFQTVGFAYLINPPLSFDHEEVFGVAKEFFGMPEESKMALAKRTFRKANKNTYRGYAPSAKLHMSHLSDFLAATSPRSPARTSRT